MEPTGCSPRRCRINLAPPDEWPTAKTGAQAARQSLIVEEETGLESIIRHFAYSGFPLTSALLHDRARALANRTPGRTGPGDLGHTWRQGNLLRHPAIRSQWSRCLDDARLNGANEADVRKWFDPLTQLMRDYSVGSIDAFNMDETEFMIGQAGSGKAIVPASDRPSRFKAFGEELTLRATS